MSFHTDRPAACEILSSSVCNLNCSYCTPKGTKIMMADFTEKNIEDVKIGDLILGFDEYPKSRYKQRSIKPTKVVNASSRKADGLIAFEFKGGSKLQITAEHPMLTIRGSSRYSWREAGKYGVGQLVGSINYSNTSGINYESKEYKLGYLIAAIKGDGTLKKYDYTGMGGSIHYRFRFVVKDEEMLDYVSEILDEMEIGYRRYPFKISSKHHLFVPSITIQDKGNFEKIESIISNYHMKCESREYCAGFLAGIYDAEGSIDKTSRVIRICNGDMSVLEFVKRSLRLFNIGFDERKTKTCVNLQVWTIRIITGRKLDNLKFLSIVNNKIKRKGCGNFYHAKLLGSTKISKKEYFPGADVYNLETESGTYFANGIAVHNCFIPKVRGLKKFLPGIMEKVRSGKYVDEIWELYGENLEHVNLWGTEPLTTLPEWTATTIQIMERFKRLKTVGFSTNMIIRPEVIYDYIKALPKDRDGFTVDLQISIDGPPEVTDKNRGDGSTFKITSNFIKLLGMLNELDLGKMKVAFRVKPTFGIDDVKWYAGSTSRLFGYIHFFDRFVSATMAASKNKSVRLNIGASPTMVVPGTYTSDDGKVFAQFLRNIAIVEDESASRPIFRNFRGGFSTYEERFMRTLRFSSEYVSKQGMFTCSGGDSNFQIDSDGNVHICHRTLFFNSEEYLDEVVKSGASGMRRTRFMRSMVEAINKSWVVKLDDPAELSRFEYVTSNYHNDAMFKLHATIALVYELAAAGQINSVYLKPELAMYFSAFLNSGLSCPAENLLNNGSIHIPSISLIRLFCNGGFELIFGRAVRRAEREYIL